jgi:hypothetical protein
MKIKTLIYILFVTQFSLGQQSNQMWKGYFSYNEIVDVESASNAVFA